MASYAVEYGEHERIVIVKLFPGYDFDMDSDFVKEEIGHALDDIRMTPIILITDFSKLDMTFSDLVSALGTLTKGKRGSLSDSRIRNVFVGTDEMVKLAAESMFQTQYGKLTTIVFRTTDEAVKYGQAILGY